MKSQVRLLVCLLEDFSEHIGYDPSSDIVTIEEQIRFKGTAYLEVALPRFDDLLLEGLKTGTLPVLQGVRTHRSELVPLLFRGFWTRVFDPQTGVLLADPDPFSIRSLRQLFRLCKKKKEVCHQRYIDSAVSDFIATDSNLPWKMDIPEGLRDVCKFLFGDIIGRAIAGSSDPKHGPGAVSEKLGTNSRWRFDTISPNAEALVGAEYFRSDWYSVLTNYPQIATIPARLVAVPKTYTKPRLISIEPSYNQFMQQSLHLALERELEYTAVADFTDQEPNKVLAKRGSITGHLATIDLSEASDRVSLALVRELFSFNPSFWRFLFHSRSPVVSLPNGDALLLRKFASMGSALTFPIETMVFTAIVIYSICEQQGVWDREFVRSILYTSGEVRVYGDDIIVPTQFYPTVKRNLEAFGLKVNDSKSFPSGEFRESCGGDYFRGYDVSPVYLRKEVPSSRRHVEELVSWSETRNQLVERYGYGRAVDFIDRTISKIIPYPAKLESMVGIGRVGPADHVEFPRTSGALQRGQIRIMVPSELYRDDIVDGEIALHKCLRTGLNEDPRHLVRDGRPVAARLIYRWVTAP